MQRDDSKSQGEGHQAREHKLDYGAVREVMEYLPLRLVEQSDSLLQRC